MPGSNELQATEQPGEGGAICPAGDEKERVDMTAETSTLQRRAGAFIGEVEALDARRRYAPGALRPVPGMESFVSKPEDPVQRIVRDGERLYLTIGEAAEIARTTKQTIINLLKDGRLRGCRFGRRHTLVSLASFIDEFRPWGTGTADPAGNPTDSEMGADGH